MAAALLAGCSQEETPGVSLSPGEYPLILTAGGLKAVATPTQKSAPSTRGTVDNDWRGVTSVAVEADNEVKEYKVTPLDGESKTAKLEVKDGGEPFYWQSTTETKTITAWHPYSNTYPTAWTVEANQNANDGYKKSDLIKATATLTFDQRNTPITFEHQIAKVIVKLTADAGVTLDGITAVQLLDIEGVKSGNTITACKSDEATYLALLNGQKIEANKGFIQVNVGDNRFVYTPTAAKTLANGTVYTYTITVKASGIEVTAATGGEWTDSGSENVGVTITGVTITYDGTETEPKIGDYYYSDGTWSDGGLRKLYDDGTMEWAKPQPQPENGKNVIAIVFHAGHHENDGSDYSATGIGQQKCHGYAVALQDATNDCRPWGVYGTELGCCPTDGSGNKQDNSSTPDIDWSGYAWTQKIITAAGGKDKLNTAQNSGYPATYYAVVDYASKVPSPANSTGWFLPSIGQMWNVYQNRTSLFEGKTVVSGLKSDWYWSSSEYYSGPANYALYVDVSNDRVRYYRKSGWISYVRPVLAF